VLFQRVANAPDDLVLLRFTQSCRGNDIGVVGAPVSNANLFITADDVLKRDRLARRRMEHGLPFIGGSPLRTGYEELPARFRRIRASASLR
jgi:hypothetical protein